jgi:hypothetical protein
MRFVLLLLLLMGLGQPGLGQVADPSGEKKVALSFAALVPMSLLALVNTMPQRPSLDGSLARRYYARNRVRTVALVRVRAGHLSLYRARPRRLPGPHGQPSFPGAQPPALQLPTPAYQLYAEPGFALVRQTTYAPLPGQPLPAQGRPLATLERAMVPSAIRPANTKRFCWLRRECPRRRRSALCCAPGP